MRHDGWRTTLFTTNVAQALFKLLIGYFEQCRNKHLKHYKRPLAYQYEAGDVASKYLPGVRYKVWGHAEQKWRGENDSVEGKDLRPYVQPPNPAHRPEKLPPVPWEREWFEDILKDGHLLNEKWIVWDGEEGAGGLAGRRASAEYSLSEEERLRMPRVNFRNDGTAPPHPAWRGCRLLDASEVWDFNNPPPPPPDADKVDRLLQSGAPALAKATVAQLKAWLAVHRQTVTGNLVPKMTDKIYVLGGGHLNSVEAFDTDTKRWTAVAPMAWKRHCYETAMLDEHHMPSMVECGIETMRLGHALSADFTGRTDHAMSGKEERKATPEMTRKEKAARSRLRTKMMNDLEGSQSKANLCCGSRFACTARVHVAFITMFEETEATKASVEEWLQWKNKGELVKETVTARFHGFRMKAASDLLQLIDENVRIEEVEEDDDYDDIPLSHLVRVPEVLQQNAPPAEVVIPDDDKPYPAEDPDAPAPEVCRHHQLWGIGYRVCGVKNRV
eukprot:g66201.t1